MADILDRLRTEAEYAADFPGEDDRLYANAVSEIEDLRRWKASATVLLEKVRVGELPALEAVEIAARKCMGKETRP